MAKGKKAAKRLLSDPASREEGAAPVGNKVLMVRDKPTQSQAPTHVEVDDDEEEIKKYEAGGWRRANAKEAKAVQDKLDAKAESEAQPPIEGGGKGDE